MLNYANLSDVEFEYLCQDIMERILGKSLRRFAQGKDGGIDLTDDVAQKKVIVQVKHYVYSSTSALITSLKKEKSKVDAHKPQAYYICCSRSLSPQKVQELFAYFSDYMASDRNIVTLNEIESFLQDPKNSDILQKHYKLWIDSVGILDQVRNKAIFIDCAVLLSDIEKEKRFFVKTEVFKQAVKYLKNNKALFITGNPGVGKTTTSKMLVLYYAALGYRVRFTTNTSDLRELKNSLSQNKNVKEIILVDDCFGQAYFKMQDSQNEDLLSLIKHVHISKNKLLILNSRITIFQEAKVVKPTLVKSLEDGEYKVFLLDMNALSPVEKTKIFYNHLFFNKIPSDYLKEIRKDKRYLQIIQHKNYNPRLISIICNPNRYKGIPANEYYDFICKHLENPREIWRDEYEDKLSKTDRILLTTLYSLTDFIAPLSLLQFVFEKRIAKEADIDKTVNQFQASLRRLSESFVTLLDNNGTKAIKVVNPSVNDYLDGRMKENPLERQSIIENAAHIQQLTRLFSEKEFEDFIKKVLETHRIDDYYFESKQDKITFIAYYVSALEIFDKKYTEYLQSYLSRPTHLHLKEYKMVFSVSLTKTVLSPKIRDFYQLDSFIIANDLTKTLIEEYDLEDMIEIISVLSPLFTGSNRESFVDTATETLKDAIDNFVGDVDADLYVSDPSSAINYGFQDDYFDLVAAVDQLEDEVIDRVLDSIDDLLRLLPKDIKIDSVFLDSLVFNINGAEELIEEGLVEYENEYDPEDYAEPRKDDEIDYIFERDD